MRNALFSTDRARASYISCLGRIRRLFDLNIQLIFTHTVLLQSQQRACSCAGEQAERTRRTIDQYERPSWA